MRDSRTGKDLLFASRYSADPPKGQFYHPGSSHLHYDTNSCKWPYLESCENLNQVEAKKSWFTEKATTSSTSSTTD